MSNATIEQPAVTEDLSFVESFQAFMQGDVSPQPQTPEPEVASEPKAKTVVTPAASPEEELEQVSKETVDKPEIELPIDEIDKEEETASDDDDKDNPYEKGTAQHKRFREMRKEAAVLKGTVEAEAEKRRQAEAKLSEIEARAARAQELEEKIKEYEARATLTDITQSETYQETIVKPLQDIITRSDALAERLGIDPDDLATALEIGDDSQRRARFKELTSGIEVDPDDHYEMRALAERVQPLKAKREEILENADKALAEIEATREKQRRAETLKAAELRKATVDQVAEHLSTKLPFLKSLEGVDLDTIVAKAKDTDPSALATHTQAYNTIAGELLPKFIRKYASLTKQVEELSDELSSYKKQTPRLTPDTSGGQDTAEDEDGLVDRYKKTFGNR